MGTFLLWVDTPLPSFSSTSGKLFDKFHRPTDDVDAWRACRARLKAILQAGYCVSRGELQPDVVGFGVPVIPLGEHIGSISLVCSRERAELLDAEGIGELLIARACAGGADRGASGGVGPLTAPS